MNCESLFDHAAGFLDGSLDRHDREAVLRHLEACGDCRALLASLEAAGDPGLADGILARTSGGACGSARSRLCECVDGELGTFDAALVDGHLEHCAECRALSCTLEALRAELPLLARVDPGPWFVEAVLARTSRRPRRAPFAERWVAVVSRLLDRPRIALEGAFVAVVAIGLPFAVSPVPIAGEPSHAVAGVRDAMHDLEARVHIEARSAWAEAHAFVVESSTRIRQGTFSRIGASGETGGGNTTNDRNPETAQENRQ